MCVSCGTCLKNCPSGCIDVKEKSVENEVCINCLKCLSICPKNAVKYGIKPKEEIKFNIKRREALWGISAIFVLGAGYFSGLHFVQNAFKKVKNIILPAGASSITEMGNRCLNCNVCINNCPNKILSKANSDFQAVHIDYNLGLKHCKFDCNNCSTVCPSGAIKKLTLEEKQNTRIAMASINSENCTGCGLCASSCPKGAIKIVQNKAQLNGENCIGCGLCASVCKTDSIEIFSVNKQTLI